MKTAALIFLTTATSLCAVENASKGGFAPPKKYGLERYETEWNRNPFSVPTPPSAPVAAVSAFKDMAIAAIYGQKDKPTIYMVNIATKKRTRLPIDKPNEDGISLKSFSISPSRKDTTIEVSLGTETATLHYDETYMKGAADGQGRPPGAIGAAGGNMAPGMPRIPLPGGAQNPATTANRNIPQINGRQNLSQSLPGSSTNANMPKVYGAPAISSAQNTLAIPTTGGGTLTLTAPLTSGGTQQPTTITVGSGSGSGTTTNVPVTPGAAAPGVSNRRRTLISVPQAQ